ncbi:MAG: ABC transporter substrate-binding protein [Candidatus Limnocylindrales bacterium]
MNRADRTVAVALVALLAVIAAAIVWPSVAPAAAPGATATPAALAVYREGIIGRPSSITPLTARTQADRDLVSLVFSGLVRLAPGRGYVGELAESWTVDPSARTYTFTLRPDAAWQDGQAVTAADVVFTVHLLKDPAYDGPLAGSWGEATATEVDQRTVRFDLATPLAGFLGAATVPILPQHLLEGLPVSELADSDFARHPIGSGHFRLESWDGGTALLRPVAPAAIPAAASDASAGPAAHTLRPEDPQGPRGTVARLPGIELIFYDDVEAMAAAFRAGQLDAVGGLTPPLAHELFQLPGAQLLRYSRTTLTTVALNLRPTHPEFRDARVRLALLQAVDRSGLVQSVLDGTGARADSLIPPTSAMYDPVASPEVAFDPKAAAAGLKKAGWKQTAAGWFPVGAKQPLTVELAAVEQASNPMAWATAEVIATDWRAIGLAVNLVGLSPAALLSQRLTGGHFSAVLLDVNLGLDPDLYPLLASTQAVSGGSNVAGIQDGALDKLLIAARVAVSDASRRKAYAALQTYLAKATVLLPLYYRDYLFVASGRLQGPVSRALADPSERYWDVLDWRLVSGGRP